MLKIQITHLQDSRTGHQCVEILTILTNETLTRPENRSIVCGNTSDTVTKPNHRVLICGNTNNTNNIPRIGRRCVETLTIQMTSLQDLRTGYQCMKTLYKQHTNKA